MSTDEWHNPNESHDPNESKNPDESIISNNSDFIYNVVNVKIHIVGQKCFIKIENNLYSVLIASKMV